LFFVTTSRKPCASTRKTARWLAAFLGGAYEPRGKQSVAEASESALALGLKKIAFVHDRNGNPSEIAFLDCVKQEWLEPSIKVKSVRLPEGKPRSMPTAFVVKNEGGDARVAALFAGCGEPEGGFTEILLTPGAITLGYGKAVMRIAFE